MPGNAPSYLKPGTVERILGRTLVFLVWIGLIRGHFYVLEVRGRKSGKTISLLVDPIDLEGGATWSAPAAIPTGCAMRARQARSCSPVRRAATTMPSASFPPACVHRFSKPILTASPAKCSASSPSRRARRHLVAWISRVDAVIAGPLGLMRCGRSWGVPAPACGSGCRQQLPPRLLDACRFASAARDRLPVSSGRYRLPPRHASCTPTLSGPTHAAMFGNHVQMPVTRCGRRLGRLARHRIRPRWHDDRGIGMAGGELAVDAVL